MHQLPQIMCCIIKLLKKKKEIESLQDFFFSQMAVYVVMWPLKREIVVEVLQTLWHFDLFESNVFGEQVLYSKKLHEHMENLFCNKQVYPRIRPISLAIIWNLLQMG